MHRLLCLSVCEVTVPDTCRTLSKGLHQDNQKRQFRFDLVSTHEYNTLTALFAVHVI
jgi:hypothetical protein